MMGTPPTPQARMDALYDWGGRLVQRYVHEHYPLDIRILDVGAGWGKYRDLLDDYPNMDACEIWEPYVKQERLDQRYRHVFMEDVMMLAEWPCHWDLVVFGDVLEHLTREQAKETLAWATSAVVVVPFTYPQGEEEGNPYERHLQDDLTPELMANLYPELTEIGIDWRGFSPYKGLYVKEHP